MFADVIGAHVTVVLLLLASELYKFKLYMLIYTFLVTWVRVISNTIQLNEPR